MALPKVPERRFFGETMSTLIVALHLAHQAESASGADTLLGYRVPDFQRSNDRWTRDQQVSFIEAIYQGANIGAFMVNMSPVSVPELDNLLLDGLQRMTALKAYFRGDFGVAGEDRVDRLWTGLDHADQARFLRINFPWILTRYGTREDAIDAYERHNFSGTQHTEENRMWLERARRAG